jgi:hypothetical protein
MPRPPQYSDDELLNALRDLAEDLDRVPRKKDMNEYGPHAPRTYQLRFGSWNDAVREAGFTPRSKGTEFGERPDTCPLCGCSETGLDYHHWRYGMNKQGCYLCRDCHDAVHAGAAGTDNPDWLLHCINNLVVLHLKHHHDQDPAVTDAAVDRVNVSRVIERYNLPNNTDLIETAVQAGRES